MSKHSFGNGWAVLVRAFCWIGMLGLLALTLVTLYDVAMRSGLGRPILGLNELFVLFGAASATAFFPYGLASRHLLTVRFLGTLAGQTTNKYLDWFGDLVTLLFFTILLWRIYVYTANVVAHHETTYLLGLAIGPWWIWSVICLAMSAVTQLLVLLDIVSEEMLTPKGLRDNAPETTFA